MAKRNQGTKKSRCRGLATVTSLIEFRSKLQGTAGDARQVIRSGLWDDGGPLGNSGATDPQGASSVSRFPEVRDNVAFEHSSMLTIVPFITQPCFATLSLTSVSDMKATTKTNWQDCETLGERLAWAMNKAQVSRSQVADACGVSAVAVGKWIGDETKDIRMSNLFTAADLCLVNVKWLAIGAGNPASGIPSIYTDVSGSDLQIARDLTKLDDQRLRTTVRELVAARAASLDKAPATKKPKARRERG